MLERLGERKQLGKYANIKDFYHCDNCELDSLGLCFDIKVINEKTYQKCPKCEHLHPVVEVKRD